MKKRNQKLNKKRLSKSRVFILIVNLLFTIIFVSSFVSLHVIPFKFVFFLVFVLLLLNIAVLFLLKRKRVSYQIFGYLITIFLILIETIGIYYVDKTNQFLNQAFGQSKGSYTTTFYVLTKVLDQSNKIEDYEGQKISFYSNAPHMEDATNKLSEYISYEKLAVEDLYSLFNDLGNNETSALLIDQNYYDFVFDAIPKLKKEDYQLIHSFELTFQIENQDVGDVGESFNVYIGGNDFTGSLMDFNMILTVNMKKHQVLMTSIPRDYYIPVSGLNGRKDTLSFMGSLGHGIETNRKSLEEFFGIDLSYYVKLDTKSLVGIVDEVGGIEYCSDVSYWTTHATILDSYDDTQGEKLYVQKGCQHFNGIQTLTVARERKAFPGGDRQRQKNCQDIIQAIFKKLLSTNTITNYNNILNSLSDLYQTNIPRDKITDLLYETINGANWVFQEQSVNGSDGENYVRLTNILSYVMYPNMDTVNSAIVKMKEVLN